MQLIILQHNEMLQLVTPTPVAGMKETSVEK
jgi:hypothetical protein